MKLPPFSGHHASEHDVQGARAGTVQSSEMINGENIHVAISYWVHQDSHIGSQHLRVYIPSTEKIVSRISQQPKRRPTHRIGFAPKSSAKIPSLLRMPFEFGAR